MARGPKRPKGATAVMAERAAATTYDEDPRRRLWRSLDYYPTPPWAGRAGAELIKLLDPSALVAWEPACGEGHLAEPLKGYFDHVLASDIHGHGYGQVSDFLLGEAPFGAGEVCDWVVTNPPFKSAEQFLRRGLAVARRGVALLVRLAFLESEERHALLYGDNPVTVVAPFSERVAMQLGSWDPRASTATAYAWFIWLKGAESAGQLRPIAPGAKRRLTRPHDIQRFAAKGDTPLFDGASQP